MSNDRNATLTAEDRHHLSSESANAAADLPLPDLFKRFTSDVTGLIASEMALARAEFASKVPKAGQTAGLFGAATLLALGAFFALTVTIIAGIAAFGVPFWAAALIVTVLYGAGAAVAGLRGKTELQQVTEPLPRVANHIAADVETLKAGFERGR